ncbi:MAG: hypothetical protein BGO01_07415 [Armatimonadetes bacterium 55-13]|nr:GNAT family N-acetyltransferase [Armatimonadota bacterium]OJU63694.1 MAG: hypothetical protein BGO01_07415 [Armatimonadetes bacterium 55-13]
MQVRELDSGDVESILELRRQGLLESPQAFGSSLEEEDSLSPELRRSKCIAYGEDFILGAFDEQGCLVGMAGFRREKRQKSNHLASIWGMYVSPEFRCRGVGKQLLTMLINRARSTHGVEQIMLDVVKEMVPARRLYLGHGFEIDGLFREALREGNRYYDVEHMTLFLNRKPEA